MGLTEAINIIKQIGANYRGTLQDHQSIQEAIKVVEEAATNAQQAEK